MRGHPKLSPSDWANVVTLYERGEKNTVELAEMYGVSRQAISKGLKDRGIEKGSSLAETSGAEDDTARKERERRVQQANTQVETFAKYNDVLAKLTMERVITGHQNGTLASKSTELRALKDAATIIEKARRENWDILQVEELLGENAELPDLNVGEYTPEELEAIREANEDHYQENMRSSGGDEEPEDDEDED